MSKYFKLWKYYLLLLPINFLIVACSNDDKKNDSGSATDTTTADPKKAAAGLTSGSLDTLYIGRAAFDTINNGSKLVFSFTFTPTDELTLHGWLFKGAGTKEFDSLPNIKLQNGGASRYTYGMGTYFGNVVLKSNDYNKLKIALNDATIKYVVFAPIKYGDNIGYKVCVSRDDPGLISVATVDPIDAELNPSPPKNY